ncbi:MAG: hypothetical protein NVSMB45_09610 [Ginsengibacter sp.]
MISILHKTKPMSQVNLDALIKREDLFKVSDDDSGFNEIPDNKVYRIDADLNPRKSHTFKTLRKADFQRETSEWKPERIVGLVKSFYSIAVSLLIGFSRAGHGADSKEGFVLS